MTSTSRDVNMAEATVDESGVTADSGLSEEDRGLDGAVFSDGQVAYRKSCDLVQKINGVAFCSV